MSTLPTKLQSAQELHIRQKRELAELIGIETRNKFEIKSAEGQLVAYAAEERKGVWDFLFRQFLGHWRRFDILIFDDQRQPVFRAKHPFRWIFQRMEIFDSQGTLLGAFQQRFAILSKSFDVEGPDGTVHMTVRSPFWRIWTFPFMSSGREVARVEKRWSGLLREAFTDQDFFVLKMDPSLTLSLRPLMLAAAIFIDLQYFERKARN
jgi:uncharacterized protein YxjI